MGYISHIHLVAYSKRKDVRVKAIADSNQGLLLRKADELHISDAYPDYRFLLRDPSIDVVVIMTPHYLHKQIACAAVEAGKIVICEKPLATTIEDVDAIYRASQQTGNGVYIKEYFRYSLVNQKALKLVHSGAIGKPYFAQCTFTGDSRKEFLDLLSWRGTKIQSGGGVFMDVGVHILDWLQLMFGPAQYVYSQHRNITAAASIKGEDVATVVLEYPENIIANITTTQNDIGYRFRWDIRIFGTNGVLTIQDDGTQFKTMRIIKENNVKLEYKERDWWRESNIRALNDILDDIQNNTPPTVSHEHTRSVLNTVFRSYDSAMSGKRIKL